MKLTQTGFPRRFARSIVPPPTWGTASAGAGSPTWKGPAAPELDAPAVGDAPEPEALGDDTPAGDAETTGIETEGAGTGVAADPRSGAKARIPPSTSSATATPASRPAMIDKRGHMIARRVPVPTAGSVTKMLPLRFRSHGRPFRFLPHPIASGTAHRGWRHAAGGWPADVHGPGRGRARRPPHAAPDRGGDPHAVAARDAPADRDADTGPYDREPRPRPGRDTRPDRRAGYRHAGHQGPGRVSA